MVGPDIGSFLKEAQQRIAQSVELQPGNDLSWDGQFENQQQAMRRLGVIAPAVATLIFVLLLVTFGRVQSPGTGSPR